MLICFIRMLISTFRTLDLVGGLTQQAILTDPCKVLYGKGGEEKYSHRRAS
jgi:hypothetical protein